MSNRTRPSTLPIAERPDPFEYSSRLINVMLTALVALGALMLLGAASVLLP